MDPELRGRLHRVVKQSLIGKLELVLLKNIDIDAAAEAVTWDVIDAFIMLVCSQCGSDVTIWKRSE